MSTVGNELNQIAQVEVPSLADDFPDLLNVVGETSVSDSGGGYFDSASSSVYSNVPCVYVPLSGNRTDANGKLLSVNAYEITMPAYMPNRTRINLDDSHRLVVLARGLEPQKVFQIKSIGDQMGVIYQVTCILES